MRYQSKLFRLNLLARALAFVWDMSYHRVKEVLADTDEGTRQAIARSRRVAAVMREMRHT